MKSILMAVLVASSALAWAPSGVAAQTCEDFDMRALGAIDWATSYPPGNCPDDDCVEVTNDSGDTYDAAIVIRSGANRCWHTGDDTDTGTLQALISEEFATKITFYVYKTDGMTIKAWDSNSNLIHDETVSGSPGWTAVSVSDGDGVLIVEVVGDLGEVYFDDVCWE